MHFDRDFYPNNRWKSCDTATCAIHHFTYIYIDNLNSLTL